MAEDASTYYQFLLQAALQYRRAGICTVPVDDNKRCIVSWKEFQDSLPTETQLRRYFSRTACAGLAIVCGAVSGNLEVIDIDSKYQLEVNLFDAFRKVVPPALFNRLVIATTRSGGYHLYYRYPGSVGSRLLARRPTTALEKLKNPDDRYRVLIETRGYKGYVVAYPSRGYHFISDNRQIPLLTSQEREILLAAARQFNQELPAQSQQLKARSRPVIIKGESPLDDYNSRGDVIALLEKHGWVKVRTQGTKTHFRRPGQTSHEESGNYDHALQWFSVFTTSSDFVCNKGYRPAAVYAVLECNGDFIVAAQKLLAEGYGKSYRQSSPLNNSTHNKTKFKKK